MSEIIELNRGYSGSIIKKAARSIMRKEIIIMPSDTIYGFLALPECEERIREIKKRDDKPFLFLISGIEELDVMGIDHSEHKRILKKYWPGPVTFIMKRTSNDDNKFKVKKNYKTIGARMPDFPALADIIKRSGSPLISTSVNFSGEKAIDEPEEIIEKFGKLTDLIIIDKKFKAGAYSTIADLSEKPFKIIRKGIVNIDEISY